MAGTYVSENELPKLKAQANELIEMIQGELSFVKRDTDYEANRDTWMKRYIRRSCLQVLTAGKAYIFWDSDCGFDIFQKATEINDAIAAINEESEVVRREAENAEKSKRTEELNSQKKGSVIISLINPVSFQNRIYL